MQVAFLEPAAIERAAQPPSARIAQASLVLGLLGIALGLFVGASRWVEPLQVFHSVRVVPYVLGGASMLTAIVSIVIEKRYRFAGVAFATGVGAVLISASFVYMSIASGALLVLAVIVAVIAG